MSCDVIHHRFPASLSSENHERRPSKKSAREPLSIVARERNVINKLVNINNFFFKSDSTYVIPKNTRGMTSGRAIPQGRFKQVLNTALHSQISIDIIDRIFRKSLESMDFIFPVISLESYGSVGVTPITTIPCKCDIGVLV